MVEHELEIMAFIPARSGSKSVVDKNIRPIMGKPMLAYSVEQALASRLITRTIVSTDSERYAEIAREYGAETPFLRPDDISQDDSTDLEAFTHALNWLLENEQYRPDLCVHLRPTYPVRKPEEIDEAIQLLIDHPEADSVRSIAPAKETPFKMWFMAGDGILTPVVQTDIPEAHSRPRQQLPTTYLQNACIDVLRTETITKLKSMTGTKTLGYLMDENFDIDTVEQLKNAETFLAQAGNERSEQSDGVPKLDGQKTFCFDIDGVLAELTPDCQYDQAGPITDNVELVNALYDQGHTIVLFTARGTVTGIDWADVTKKQMEQWGVKYHELLFGKPSADYYVDDRFIDIERLRSIVEPKHR
ncbi:MAG: acylneuraminate cytidylyltransferase [Candidatus Hydrogenedentes bacterium]|nr:acylneuraminate cytidylyltransferase [Candidatus Hydrogenedentota bacterium]